MAGAGAGKKRKKSYYIKCAKKPKKAKELKNGSRGFLITCNNGAKFSNMVRTEAYSILNEYADLKFGPEKIITDASSDEEETNLEDALKKEVLEIKHSNSKDAVRRFQYIPTKMKSFIFVETTLMDPAELLDDIFSDLLTTRERKTKFCQRFLPVDCACHAKHEDIVEAARNIVKPIFVDQTNTERIQYCLAWRATSNSSLTRDDIFEEVNVYINSKEEHIAEYKTPDIVVNFQIVANTCFISILRNYVKYKKFNIEMIQNVDGEKIEEKALEVNEHSKTSEPNEESETSKVEVSTESGTETGNISENVESIKGSDDIIESPSVS